ncbi:MAG: molecular chaperone DnaJ [Alphaproteobacteria bacterium]|nr:molecular chaperone DnaJ [Alphaproteobacteria bacterium]MDE2014249.1 molecular chaperone DnaJ [Alphaproteobacteria bacterium]MDE2074222.1 molecular chaperone DnaJ [Alphaproteobacteria bacterium]MDE2352246.1 molecular chaperone DnaJ [Alphaproteobacteria bacterium]
MKRCYYETLGCQKGATVDEIKASYRKLAKELHPDRNPGDATSEHKFKEVNEAYDVLKDEQKRAAYDRYGHAAFENGGRGQAGGFGDFASSFSDIFDDLFGEFTGGRRARRQNRGADLRYNLEISLEDAFRGYRAEINVPTAVACEACGGTGASAGSQPEQCPTCSGAGKVRAQQGFFTIERTCPACRGQGRIIRNPCKGCQGSGHVQKERTLAVDVPSGVEEGTRIRLAGEGQAGMNGGPAGDLYIFVSVTPHPIFQRDGHDLYCRCPISFVTAALGGHVDVPTLDGGKVAVKIPEGTQSGRQFRMRAKGMPVLRGGGVSGDLYVEVAVETPVKLSKKQKELLRAFEKDCEPGTQPEAEGFFAKVKDFLKGDATD